MRINLNGRYNEVSQYLRPPPKGEAVRPEFAVTLGSLRDADQGIDTSAVMQGMAETGLQTSSSEDPSAMARYSFSESLPDLPEAPRFSQEPGVNEVAQVPTTPEMVSARRVEISTHVNVQELPKVKALVDRYGKEHGVDPALGLAVASVESSFRSSAVSNDQHQSKGLFQLLDRTGKELFHQAGYTHEYEPFNPELNTDLGLRYLRTLHELFSNESTLNNGEKTVPAANSASLEKLAVAAFNAGQGRVAAAQRQARQHGADPSQFDQVEKYLPQSTQEYVQKVLSSRATFEPLYPAQSTRPVTPTVVLANTLHMQSIKPSDG